MLLWIKFLKYCLVFPSVSETVIIKVWRLTLKKVTEWNIAIVQSFITEIGGMKKSEVWLGSLFVNSFFGLTAYVLAAIVITQEEVSHLDPALTVKKTEIIKVPGGMSMITFSL